MHPEDRVAVVTGGSSGIGRGISTRLAADGLDVIVADRCREPKQGELFQTDVTEPTDEVIEATTNSSSMFVETDVTEESDVDRMVTETIDRFGRLDVLVNNAGTYRPGGTRDQSLEDWQHVVDVNLTGYFLTAKYALEHLADAEAGRIVNVSSINATFGGIGPSYAATKAGIVNLTRDLAVEGAEEDVTANAVLPGVVKTAAQDHLDEEKRREEQKRTLLDRLGEPDDVASAVSFFVSRETDWVTGSQVVVDGGYIAGQQ